ncbi:hypothetical protein [Nocardia sp. NPDC046763]|uniref:hypothetical protein n=1 Tax=Nocardia sp. NPDC046763 TaxID=3155256 RepID=UPI0033DCBD98
MEPLQEFAFDAPQQKGAEEFAAARAVLDVPGIDVGLAAGGKRKLLVCKPFQKPGCVHDMVVSVASVRWVDRLAFGLGAQLRQKMPGREAADNLGVVGVGDGGEVADQPAFESADLFVDSGQNTAGHQHLPQMCCGAPGFERMECLVGQLDVAAPEVAQQVRWGSVSSFSWIEPGQARQRIVHGEQIVDEGNEFGFDPAGAVVEYFAELVAEGASGAEAVGVDFCLRRRSVSSGIRFATAGG